MNTNPNPSSSKTARNVRAFTLIELLVIIAMTAVLACLLPVALAHTWPDIRAAQCLNNKRQLALACEMYSHDYNSYLVPNAPASADFGYGGAGWCPGVESWGSAWANTFVVAYRTNGLGPYIRDVTAYRCPSDTIPSNNGVRIRSISMNPALVGNLEATCPGAYSAMVSMLGSNWRLYQKLTDLTAPTPANTWIFIDESMYSLNDGCLQMSLSSPAYPTFRLPIITEPAIASPLPMATPNLASGCGPERLVPVSGTPPTRPR